VIVVVVVVVAEIAVAAVIRLTASFGHRGVLGGVRALGGAGQKAFAGKTQELLPFRQKQSNTKVAAGMGALRGA